MLTGTHLDATDFFSLIREDEYFEEDDDVLYVIVPWLDFALKVVFYFDYLWKFLSYFHYFKVFKVIYLLLIFIFNKYCYL